MNKDILWEKKTHPKAIISNNNTSSNQKEKWSENPRTPRTNRQRKSTRIPLKEGNLPPKRVRFRTPRAGPLSLLLDRLTQDAQTVLEDDQHDRVVQEGQRREVLQSPEEVVVPVDEHHDGVAALRLPVRVVKD